MPTTAPLSDQVTVFRAPVNSDSVVGEMISDMHAYSVDYPGAILNTLVQSDAVTFKKKYCTER